MANETHRYTEASQYTVTQTVSNSGGSATSAPQTVTVTDPIPGGGNLRSISKQTSNSGTSLSIASPASSTQNDLWVLILVQRNLSATWTVPTAWTQRGAFTSQAGKNTIVGVYTRTVPASPGATAITSSVSNPMVGYIMCFNGSTVNTTTPMNVAPAGWYTSASSSTAIPAVTTTADNTIRVALVGQEFATTDPTLTMPAAWTFPEFNSTSAGSGNIDTALGYISVASASTTGSPTASSSASGEWFGTTFALNPAPVVVSSTRFPGDPGKGRTYISANVDGGGYANFQSAITLTRNRTYTGGAANSNRDYVCFADYGSGAMSASWTGSSAWQNAYADGRFVFLKANCAPAEMTEAAKANGGSYASVWSNWFDDFKSY
jgi:hypothetical protein